MSGRIDHATEMRHPHVQELPLDSHEWNLLKHKQKRVWDLLHVCGEKRWFTTVESINNHHKQRGSICRAPQKKHVSNFSFAFAVLQFPLCHFRFPLKKKNSVFCHGSYLILVHLGIPGWKKRGLVGGKQLNVSGRVGVCICIFKFIHIFLEKKKNIYICTSTLQWVVFKP